MRVLIYGSVMIAVALGLMLFDDVEVGLPVLNVAVWTTVIMAGLFLAARLHTRSRRRVRSRATPLRQVQGGRVDLRYKLSGTVRPSITRR